MSLSACSVFCAASESSPATLGVSSFSGGMRMLCPSSMRSLLSARLPLTRNSPLRTMRWMWENDRPGKRASRKRSTRMLFSSAVTTTVCTLVGSGGGSGTTFSGSGMNGGGFGARGAEPQIARPACRPGDAQRPLGARAPIGPRALRAIALGQWFLDATAHAVFPSLCDIGRPARRGSAAIFAPTSFSRGATRRVAGGSSKTAAPYQTSAPDAAPYRR